MARYSLVIDFILVAILAAGCGWWLRGAWDRMIKEIQ